MNKKLSSSPITINIIILQTYLANWTRESIQINLFTFFHIHILSLSIIIILLLIPSKPPIHFSSHPTFSLIIISLFPCPSRKYKLNLVQAEKYLHYPDENFFFPGPTSIATNFPVLLSCVNLCPCSNRYSAWPPDWQLHSLLG